MRNFETMRNRVTDEGTKEQEKDSGDANGSDAKAKKPSKRGAARKTKH
jgi:hypothetical protein